MTRTIHHALGRFDAKKRQKLQDAPQIERLSGKTLAAALPGSAGVAAGTALVNASGFSAHLAATTIIHAVMTTF